MAPSPVLSGVCPMHRNSCLQIWVIPAQPAWPLTEQRPGAWQTEAIPSSEDLRMFFIILHRFNQHVLLQKPTPMSLLSNRFSWICDCWNGALMDAIFYRHARHPWGCFIVTVNVAWILKTHPAIRMARSDAVWIAVPAVFSETTLSKYSCDLAVFFWTEHLSRLKSLLFLQGLFKAFILW